MGAAEDAEHVVRRLATIQPQTDGRGLGVRAVLKTLGIGVGFQEGFAELCVLRKLLRAQLHEPGSVELGGYQRNGLDVQLVGLRFLRTFQKIFENVSKEAWQQWVQHQTMLINENRLSPMDPRARKFLEEQMEQYFFGEGAELPPDYVPPK